METNDNTIKDLEKDIVVHCPHCLEAIVIEQLNCCIFRHGTLKTNGQQIDPHASKELCDFYIKNELIYGCGKPFFISKDIKNNVITDEWIAINCDYI